MRPTIQINTILLIAFIYSLGVGKSIAQPESMGQTMPFFRGCSEVKKLDDKRECSNRALVNYLGAAIDYPEEARNERIEGTVYLSFVVDSLGKVGNVMVLRGIGGGCDELAVSILKEMPRWEPGIREGNPVSVKMNLPIQFALGKEGELEEQYRIIWENYADRPSLTKEEILNALNTPVSLLDEKGNNVVLSELTFLRTKKNKFKDASSSGQVTS
ncbi:MAG: energy transducer TonB, partial [Saprospiraceae bacterium]|nr:energy transducer TonB [Saprospiraceae bacterium]